MPFHIPFEHRRNRAPVYIGFHETLPRRKNRFNWWSFGSFLVLLLSVGTLAPIALIMSVVGMRRSPRGLAFVSMVLSGIVTAFMALGLFMAIKHEKIESLRAEHRHHRQVVAKQTQVTQGILAGAEKDLREYKAENDGYFPGEYEGMLLMVLHKDAWKNELRYDVTDGKVIIRSAGADKKFNTRDDVTREAGKYVDGLTLVPDDEVERDSNVSDQDDSGFATDPE